VTYRVVWDHRALDELRQIRREHPGREGFRHVVTRVNRQLSHGPLQAGESRQHNYRVLFKYPLVVWFEVIGRLQEIRIVHVRKTNR
jgi:hypothetical protein